MRADTVIVIPSRLAATRLPNKPLIEINAHPMILHVWRRAMEADVGDVIVAAGDHEIADVIHAAGGKTILTDPALTSGTDRVADALAKHDPQKQYSKVVNLQGDLPNIYPGHIREALSGLDQCEMSTLITKLTNYLDLEDPTKVKAIIDRQPNKHPIAANFLRRLGSEYPFPYWHHIGVYAFRRAALEKFVNLAPTQREKERNLEQMRALDNGMTIATMKVDAIPQSVDVMDDILKLSSPKIVPIQLLTTQ